MKRLVVGPEPQANKADGSEKFSSTVCVNLTAALQTRLSPTGALLCSPTKTKLTYWRPRVATRGMRASDSVLLNEKASCLTSFFKLFKAL